MTLRPRAPIQCTPEALTQRPPPLFLVLCQGPRFAQERTKKSKLGSPNASAVKPDGELLEIPSFKNLWSVGDVQRRFTISAVMGYGIPYGYTNTYSIPYIYLFLCVCHNVRPRAVSRGTSGTARLNPHAVATTKIRSK